MTTREALAALSDEELDERIAVELMGWEKRIETFKTPDRQGGIAFEHQAARWYAPAGLPYYSVAASHTRCPPYTNTMHLAWQVVMRISRIPESEAEAIVAPNTRFMYAWERMLEASKHATIWAMNEQQAARWICETAYLAWSAGPLFPEEG